MKQDTTRILMDVDTGVDDALALLLAARHPGIELACVTCVAGNAGLEAVVDNTLRVLSLAGAAHVPVASGAARPLISEPRAAAHVHGNNGLAGFVLPPPTFRRSDIHAVEMMRRALLESDRKSVLVALAPLTNVALLMRMYPEVIRHLARIIVMGGAVESGNATAVAEFNVFHDPEAAAIVFGSGAPITMYGLDVFYQPALDEGEIGRLERHGDACATLASQLLRHLARTTSADSRLPFPGAAQMGDAGALCVAIEPAALSTRRLPASVSLAEGPTRGQTIVDRRTYAATVNLDGRCVAPNIDVALAVDGPRYVRLFLDMLAPAR